MHRLGIRCAEVAGVISVFRPIDAAPQAIGMPYIVFAGKVTCRSRVSASPGNHSRASSAHPSSVTGGPPGLIPAVTAAAMYFPLMRSTLRLCAISL